MRMVGPTERGEGTGPSESARAERHARDLTLVASVLGGDPGARAEFSRRMDVVGRLLVVLNGRHGRPLDDHALSDLAQDTLLAVWRKLEGFEGRASLESWVYRFTYLEFLSALRKRSRRPQPLEGLAEGELPAEAVEPDPVARAVVEADEPPPLSRFLGHLAEREAEVVRLRHLETLSFRKIGEGLGISTSSAKTHYYRGLTKLRGLMAQRDEEDAR